MMPSEFTDFDPEAIVDGVPLSTLSAIITWSDALALAIVLAPEIGPVNRLKLTEAMWNRRNGT